MKQIHTISNGERSLLKRILSQLQDKGYYKIQKKEEDNLRGLVSEVYGYR